MGESIKDALIDKIADEFLDLIFNTSKEEVEQYFNKNRRQKILYKTISDFSESVFFKKEFSGVRCFLNKDLIFGIDDALLTISLTQEELKNNLLPYVSEIFITDNKDMIPTITDNIVSLYIQRAKSTTQLYEVICIERSNYEKIDKKIMHLQAAIMNQSMRQLEKEGLFNKELSNQIQGIISEIMQMYVFLILKKSPTFEGKPENVNIVKEVHNIVNNIDALINDDFCEVPVVCNILGGFDIQTQSFTHFQFNEQFISAVLNNIDVLMKYKDIMPPKTLSCILRLQDSLHGNLFKPLSKISPNLLTNITINVADFRSKYAKIGSLILDLYYHITD